MATRNNNQFEYQVNADSVARSTETFPAGDECVLTVDELPDHEEAFGWTLHYEEESRTRTNPSVTKDVLDELLSDGVVRRSTHHTDRYLVQKEINGYEWTLVVADNLDGGGTDWILITIYSNYHGSYGTTNRYLDRLKQRKGDD